MFLPGVIAQGIESELTRFVIISVAVTQLIYMSEVGVLILKTRIPLNFINLVTLFVLRTIIALPVIVAIAQGLVAAEFLPDPLRFDAVEHCIRFRLNGRQLVLPTTHRQQKG